MPRPSRPACLLLGVPTRRELDRGRAAEHRARRRPSCGRRCCTAASCRRSSRAAGRGSRPACRLAHRLPGRPSPPERGARRSRCGARDAGRRLFHERRGGLAVGRRAAAARGVHRHGGIGAAAAGAVLGRRPGPWTPEVVDPTRVLARAGSRPRLLGRGRRARSSARRRVHVVEEVARRGRGRRRRRTRRAAVFSAVTADGRDLASSSTFLSERAATRNAWVETRPRARPPMSAPALVARAHARGVRACARPQSLDGRPLGRATADGVEGLVDRPPAHGPWGISTGPARRPRRGARRRRCRARARTGRPPAAARSRAASHACRSG